MSLPTPVVTIACGACRTDLDHDGDRFICWDCRLAYDTEDMEEPARFLDPQESVCGRPHHQGTYVKKGPFHTRNGQVVQWRTTTTTFGPCILPASHTGLCEWPSTAEFIYHDTDPTKEN